MSDIFSPPSSEVRREGLAAARHRLVSERSAVAAITKRPTRGATGLFVFAFTGASIAMGAGCGSASSTPDTNAPKKVTPNGNGSSGGSGGSSGDSFGGSSSGSGGSSGGFASSSGAGTDDGGGSVTTGDDGGTGAATDDGGDATSSGSSGSSSGSSGSSPDGAACVKGQVTPNEVVMLGDSYLDPAWSNAAVDLFANAQNAGSLPANTTYRHYYIGGAAMAWGNPGTQFYIPYQYDPMAKTDLAVTNPKDIKVIIMDGGGNDVLIGNTSCEQTAPPTNTSCQTTVQNAIDKARSEMQLMASDGIKSIVFFFYPHLDPAGGGILSTPAPAVNDTLDYAYPLAEEVCCGTSFTSTMSNYSCTGQPAPGTKCVFVDTRPAFEGHTADYIKSDHVHPTPAGAQVIADLLWKAMQDNCIAQ